jgi:hypothetical protein
LLNKIAAVLAFIIGAMAVFTGGKVLLGVQPDYYVIGWLPVYNFVAGLVSIFFSSVVIWKNTRLALPVAAATLAVHTLVMLILLTTYRPVVAPDSLAAMTIRIAVWSVILILLLIQHRQAKTSKALNPT